MGNLSESLAGRDEIVNLKSLLLDPSGFAANRNRKKHRSRRFELGVRGEGYAAHDTVVTTRRRYAAGPIAELP